MLSLLVFTCFQGRIMLSVVWLCPDRRLLVMNFLRNMAHTQLQRSIHVSGIGKWYILLGSTSLSLLFGNTAQSSYKAPCRKHRPLGKDVTGLLLDHMEGSHPISHFYSQCKGNIISVNLWNMGYFCGRTRSRSCETEERSTGLLWAYFLDF